MSDSSSPNAAPPDGIVARPPGQLHDLPIRARWEVTRRNPYYLVFWAQARAFRLSQLSDDSVESSLQFAAHLILAEIGATGEPVSPATTAEELIDGDADLSFLTGTVQPVTFRGVVAMLINGLPPADLEAIGKIFIDAGKAECPVPEDAPPTAHKTLAYSKLSHVMSRALDSIPEIPPFYVHLGASQNSIVRDTRNRSAAGKNAEAWAVLRSITRKSTHTWKSGTSVRVGPEAATNEGASSPSQPSREG